MKISTKMKPEERRNQLLDCAQTLFFSKGFNDTTLAELLSRANVSKGGFYHYFKSKDDLLLGVLGRMAGAVLAQLDVIASDDDTSALDRLLRSLRLLSEHQRKHDQSGQIDCMQILSNDTSILLREHFWSAVRDRTKPVLTKIVEEGRSDGTFKVADAETAAESIFLLVTFLDLPLLRAIKASETHAADHFADKLQLAMDMQAFTVDRMLGLPDGTIDFGFQAEGVNAMTVSRSAEILINDHAKEASIA